MPMKSFLRPWMEKLWAQAEAGEISKADFTKLRQGLESEVERYRSRVTGATRNRAGYQSRMASRVMGEMKDRLAQLQGFSIRDATTTQEDDGWDSGSLQQKEQATVMTSREDVIRRQLAARRARQAGSYGSTFNPYSGQSMQQTAGSLIAGAALGGGGSGMNLLMEG